MTFLAQCSISRDQYLRIGTMISVTMFDISAQSRERSMWNITPDFEHQYMAILDTLGMERIPSIPLDAQVKSVIVRNNSAASVMKQEAYSEASTHNDVIQQESQVACDIPLIATVTQVSELSLVDIPTMEDVDMLTNMSNTNDDTCNGLTKDEIDKSCTSGISRGTS